jgi:hypothetical protein
MRKIFKLDKETKNYVKYREEGGINTMYLPKQPEGAEPIKQFEIDVPATA